MKLGRYVIGLLSGLTFGMLFAPKKGAKLREELMRKRGESGGHDALMVLFNAFKDAGTDAVSEMKKLSENEQLRSALNMSKEKMHEYLSGLEESGYDIAARAQEKIEEFSDMAVTAGAKFKKRAVKKQGSIKKAVKNRVSTIAGTLKPKAKKTRKTRPVVRRKKRI